MCELTISQKHIITERNNSKGEYQPAFMQIRIHNSFDGNIDELDVPTLGTLVHEYIHFLQNVSTPWGLYDSMVRYNIMAETYAFVENATSTITLPLNIDYSQGLKNKMDIVECGTGYCPLSDTRRNNFKIDVSERICIHRNYKKVNNRNLPIITLDISFTDGSKQTIVLGANIIKESMAALYQMLIDETATHEEFDLPYNLIKIIAEQHFSAIASDNIKLITICYISLFSLSPAEVLIDNLAYANENPDLSAIELFERFVNEDKIYIKGKAMSVCDFFDTLIIDFLGMPYSYTDSGDFNPPPSSSIDSEKLSDDMLALIGHNALFSYLTRLHKYGYVCPLHSFCEKEKYDKDECYDEPWNGKMCPMTIMGDVIHIKEKEVKIQF